MTWASRPCGSSAPALPEVLAITLTPATARLELRLPENLLWFQGHFDDHPILPGLAQLHWAIHYAHQHFAAPADLRSIDFLKFQKPLQPADTVTLELRYHPEPRQLAFTYTRHATPASTGKLTLAS